MKISLKHIVYLLIIITSLFFIFPKTIEGNSCNSNIERIETSFIKCFDGKPNVNIHDNKTVLCDENNIPYVRKN